MRRKKTDKQWYCLPFKVLHSMYLVMHPWLDAGVWQTAGCSQQHLCRHFHRSSLQGSLSLITRGLKVPFLLPREEGKEEELSADKTGKLLWLYAANRYWSLYNTSCCPHMPSLQHLPTHSTRHSRKLGCSIRFSFSFCHYQVACCLILCFKPCGQDVHKNLHSQSWTTVLKSFPTTLFFC